MGAGALHGTSCEAQLRRRTLAYHSTAAERLALLVLLPAAIDGAQGSAGQVTVWFALRLGTLGAAGRWPYQPCMHVRYRWYEGTNVMRVSYHSFDRPPTGALGCPMATLP